MVDSPEARPENGPPLWSRFHSGILIGILVFSFLIGTAYARLLPPWDLIDEEQHFDYVQQLANGRGIPILGRTYLSSEVIDSMFATNRWAAYGLRMPASRDPQNMGLEGYSYEGYQPPLPYLLSVPIYSVLLPEDILTRLFALRMLAVLLGTASVYMSYAIARVLMPQDPSVALGSAAMLVIIPERVMAVSRFNNDAFVEVASVAALLLLAIGIARGFGWKLTVGAGLVVGAAVLVKLSALVLLPAAATALGIAFIKGRLTLREAFSRGLAMLLIVVVTTGWFFVRNLQLYGDLTGMGAFLRLISFKPDVSPIGFIWSLFRGFWAMWWEGNLATFFMVIMAGLAMFALFGLIRNAKSVQAPRGGLTLLAVLALANVIAVWQSAYLGLVPVIQGRLILPAVSSIAILFVWGLTAALPRNLQAPGIMGTFGILLLLHGVYFYFRVLVGFHHL